MTNKDCAEYVLLMYESHKKHYGTSLLIREAVVQTIGVLMNGNNNAIAPPTPEDACDLPRFNALDYVR